MTSISQKIIGGTYDFQSNILRLNVELTEGVHTHTEVREFDITSLKVTRAGKQGTPNTTVEILGARTDEAMQKIMPQIIETFKGMESGAVAGLLRHCSADSAGLKKTIKFEKAIVNNLEAALQAQDQGISLTQMPLKMATRVSTTNQEIFNDKGTGVYTYREVGHSVSTVSNPAITQALLKASNWENMIGDVEGNKDGRPIAPDHAWSNNPSKPLRNSAANLNQILDHFQQNPTLLNQACEHYHTKLAPQILQITEQIAQNEAQIEANKKRLAAATPEEETSQDSLFGTLSQQIAKLNQKLVETNTALTKRLYVIGTLPNLYRELAITLSLKQLTEQKLINKGHAPMGSSATSEWDDIICAYKLAPEHGVDLTTHIAKQLGLTIKAEFKTSSTADNAAASDSIFTTYDEAIEDENHLDYRVYPDDDEEDDSIENTRRSEIAARAQQLAQQTHLLRKKPAARPTLDLEVALDAQSIHSQSEDEADEPMAAAAAFSTAVLPVEGPLKRQRENTEAVRFLLRNGFTEEEIALNPILAPSLRAMALEEVSRVEGPRVALATPANPMSAEQLETLRKHPLTLKMVSCLQKGVPAERLNPNGGYNYHLDAALRIVEAEKRARS